MQTVEEYTKRYVESYKDNIEILKGRIKEVSEIIKDEKEYIKEHSWMSTHSDFCRRKKEGLKKTQIRLKGLKEALIILKGK